MEPTRKQLENTLHFLKHELDESNKRVRELHAAYLTSKHTMDSILSFTALSHPVLAYYMRCMRNDHEVRRCFKIRRLIEEQNEDVDLLTKALKREMKKATVRAVRQRASPRRLEAENEALRLKVVELRLYIRRIERRAHL